MEDDEFSWDDDKAELNFEKHKVSFETARKVFIDRDRFDDDDSESSFGEDRFFAIGEVEHTVYFVVFTVLDEGRVRIIAARRASKKQTDGYYRRKTAG